MELDEVAGASPKSSSFEMYVPNRSEVQNCYEFGWKNHDLVSLLKIRVLPLLEKGEKKRERTESTGGKGGEWRGCS